MTGDSSRAIDAFQRTLREAALLASRDQLPADRLWSFHEARHQCLELVKNDVQPESTKMAEEPIAPDLPGDLAAAAGRLLGRLATDCLSRVTRLGS